MNYLVLCPCSHALDRHYAHGCAGEYRSPCPCPLNTFEALDEAVTAARSSYEELRTERGSSEAAGGSQES